MKFKNQHHKQGLHLQAVKEGATKAHEIAAKLKEWGYNTTPSKVAHFMSKVPGIVIERGCKHNCYSVP